MSAVAEVTAPEASEKLRKDYKAPPYRVDSLHLSFNIDEEETLVDSALKIEPMAGTAEGDVMFLHGEVSQGTSSQGHS